jgi:hypothetical protein
VIERWLVAIRDHPERPAAAQHLVLHMLALRMDWQTGCGYASVRQLGQDAAASERTVRRGIGWARDTGFLLRTRRGHRLGSGQVVASEWRLTAPVDKSAQPATGDRLGISTGQNGNLNRPMGALQPVSGAPPSGTRSSGTSASRRAQRFEDQAPTPAPPAFSDLCSHCGGHGHTRQECPH